MDDAVTIEIALFNFHAEEVRYHKQKLRFLVSFMITICATLLVFQTKEVFDATKLDWPIMIAAGILLTGVYFALAHHCIKLLTKSTERDHHERIVRELRAIAFHDEAPALPLATPYRFNISPWAAPLGIVIVTALAWLALLVFCARLQAVSGTPPTTVQPSEIAIWKSNIQKAQNVVLTVKFIWAVISLFALVELIALFIQYWKVHRELKGTIQARFGSGEQSHSSDSGEVAADGVPTGAPDA